MKIAVKYSMRKIISVCASFLLAGVLVQNFRQQQETKRQLAEVQQKLAGGEAARPRTLEDKSSAIVLDDGDGGSQAARRQHDLEIILNTAWKLVDQRKPDAAARAVQMFGEGITNVDSNNPDLYNGLGRALLVADDPRRAIAAWRTGLVLAPTFADMQSGIGWAYWRLNDPCRAKSAWQQALAINPQSPDAWSAMAWIDLALGKCSEAKSGFQELVKFDARQKSWTMGLAMAQGGNTNVQEISKFFPLPPLVALERPLPVDPAISSGQVADTR